ncbi:LysR family transcriptional regulator [Roseibium porphyridii]|uniref:LysR family transcriptional regulator n=1 Tax=Roseibium porphyridii TaxID=2866279 RepID=A0ABY8F752_9HYPH|nr:LysR family transcriptional regulator [Roseibium sp. KMA01]WFE90324.1 LysR family transcriptional regulator [Roseibium sp. KMA01]
MELSTLKTALLVRDLGSFAAVARLLDLDASSVSRVIAQLEQDVGFRLFQRSTRSLAPTSEGELYLNRIAPLLEELEAAGDEARTTAISPRGTLRMTVSISFAQECLLPVLPEFKEKYPEIDVELLASDSNLDLRADGIDLAVRFGSMPKGDWIVSKLMTTRYRAVASPEYIERTGPVRHPDDLSERECIRFAIPGFRTYWQFREHDSTEAFAVPIGGATVISNALSIRSAARLGMGIALMPIMLIRRDLQKGTLVDLFPDYACAAASFETAAWLVYPSRSYLPQKVRVMIDFLKEHYGRPAL